MMKVLSEQANISIQFEAKLFKIGAWTLVGLPKSASIKLPSRGMTIVEGTLNGIRFQTALEPDGRGSHWFKIEESMCKATNIKVGDMVKLEIEPSNEWPRPEMPTDLKKALLANSQANSLWTKITPNAQWDWIRWIRATKNPGTRARRIEVACSKLKAGTRRPCCFNRNLCTEPYVSENWVLALPE